MCSVHKYSFEDYKGNIYYIKNNLMFLKLIDILNNVYPNTIRKNVSNDIELSNWINESVELLKNFNYSILTKINWILTNRIDYPKCHYCNKNLKIEINVFEEYPIWCSAKCRANDNLYKKIYLESIEQKYGKGVKPGLGIPSAKEKAIRTLKNKYGVVNPMQLKETVIKAKQTFIKHYGTDNNMKSQKGLDEYRQAMKNKYGIDYTWQLSSVIEKSKQTSYDRYGVYITSQSDQAKKKQAQTNMQKYGYKSALQNDDIKVKTKQTMVDKYGVEYPGQSYEIRNKGKRRYFYDGRQFDSAPEIAFYIWLKDNNIKFEYEPKSKIIEYFDKNGVKHNYNPDFWLIDIDELIEIKGDNHFENGKMINISNRSLDYIAEAKYQCMIENNVKIFRNNEYRKYIEYVYLKYNRAYFRQFKTKII